jgi:hypothetical protein
MTGGTAGVAEARLAAGLGVDTLPGGGVALGEGTPGVVTVVSSHAFAS